jgi:hypothetical protein
MQIISATSLLFITISLIFPAKTCRDYVENVDGTTIAGRFRLRMALMFAAIGIGLFFLHILFRC